MDGNVTGLPERGKTWYDGATPTANAPAISLEGQMRRVDDENPPTATDSTVTRRSGRQVVLRLVKNISGITLAPKRLVTWAAGFRGRRVDGYCTADYAECAGVVDDHYTNGIPDDDLGYIVVSGPVLILTSLAANAENVISEGDVLVALTAATSQATTSGRFVSAGLTSSVTVAQNVERGKIGRAMSAKTTANTNADCLVDLEILKAA